jgi:hypothetical protein
MVIAQNNSRVVVVAAVSRIPAVIISDRVRNGNALRIWLRVRIRLKVWLRVQYGLALWRLVRLGPVWRVTVFVRRVPGIAPWSYRDVWVIVVDVAVRTSRVAIVVADGRVVVVGLVVEWAHRILAYPVYSLRGISTT